MSLNKQEKAEIVAEMCMIMYEKFKDRPAKVRAFVEGIVGAEGIFRVPATHSGFISKAARELKNKNPKYSPTKEHFFGRRASATKIFEQLRKGKSFERIVLVILSRSRVHYTTAAENEELKKHGHLPWREAYARVGVDLVEYEGRKIKQVMIDNVVYDSVKSVAQMLGIKEQVVRTRIGSKSKKWVGWNYA